jgi:endonuclease-8
VPEGDTIAYAALRMRPVLEGCVPDAIRTPHRRHALDRWPQRLAGRTVTEIRTLGKHLFIAFDGGLVLHSHLRMTGSWGVYAPGQRPRRAMRRAWLVLERSGVQVIQFDGPVLELLTEGRARSDQRLAALGPDVLAESFDFDRFMARLRGDDPTRGIGDALLDQRNVAGIGNIWKAEGCWEAAIDPWRHGRSSNWCARGCSSRRRPAGCETQRGCSAGPGSRAHAAAPESEPADRATTTARRSGARAANTERSGAAEHVSVIANVLGRRDRT